MKSLASGLRDRVFMDVRYQIGAVATVEVQDRVLRSYWSAGWLSVWVQICRELERP